MSASKGGFEGALGVELVRLLHQYNEPSLPIGFVARVLGRDQAELAQEVERLSEIVDFDRTAGTVALTHAKKAKKKGFLSR